MPRNGSGTYTLPAGNPVEAGTLIEANWANDTLEDIGNELTNSLSRTGEGGMLAPFRLADGTLGAPGIAWLNEPSTGFYRAGTGEMWGVAQGTAVVQYTASGAAARFAAGSASTPSITRLGDLNTGLYFPGADELGIATAGVLRLSFDAAGAAAFSGALAVTGALTASGGIVGNVSSTTLAVTGDTTLGGNLALTGSAKKITGDFSNATLANRVLIQSSTLNGNTAVMVVPNGTATTGTFRAYNAADPTNASFIQISAQSTSMRVESGISGSGTYRDLVFLAGSSGSVTLDTSGNLGLGVTPSAWTALTTQQISYGSVAATTAEIDVSHNGYYSSTGWKYIANGYATNHYQANGTYVWRTAPSGTAGNAITFTQAMTLDASGNLGIGTTSPGSFLGTVKLVVGSAATTTTPGAVTVYSGTATYGGLYFADGTVGDQLYRGAVEYNHSTDALLLYSAGAERARITSGGELCVGTTATNGGARLDVKGVDSTSSTYCMFFENSSNSLLFAVQNDGRWRSGTAAASPYNYVVGATNRDLFVDNGGEIGYVSSVRASKTNIAPVSNVDWLLRLNPVTFNFRKKDADGNYTEEADGPLKHGLIAEEVEAVNSDLCFYDDAERGGALRGVNYTHLITPMLKLIQEQQAIITDLRARVAALEAK